MDTRKVQSALPHLIYEIAMLERTSNWLSRNPLGRDEQSDLFSMNDEEVIKFAVLESFLVHARLM